MDKKCHRKQKEGKDEVNKNLSVSRKDYGTKKVLLSITPVPKRSIMLHKSNQ